MENGGKKPIANKKKDYIGISIIALKAAWVDSLFNMMIKHSMNRHCFLVATCFFPPEYCEVIVLSDHKISTVSFLSEVR